MRGRLAGLDFIVWAPFWVHLGLWRSCRVVQYRDCTGLRLWGFYPPTWDSQMEKRLDNEMETGIVNRFFGRFSWGKARVLVLNGEGLGFRV